MPRGGRNVPSLQQRFALKGKMLVKYYKGKLVVQSWPKPYGKPRSEAQANTIEAFKRIQRALKFLPPQQTITAMELTAKTGMYPRDLLMQAMTGTNIMLGYDELGATPMIGDGLAKFVATGTENTITFDQIPPGYSALLMIGLLRTTLTGQGEALLHRFNNDTGANYEAYINDAGTPGNSFGLTGTFGLAAASAGCVASSASSTRALIPGYASSAFIKGVIGEYNMLRALTGSGMTYGHTAGFWRNVDAINQIDILTAGTYLQGSTVTLYGLF